MKRKSFFLLSFWIFFVCFIDHTKCVNVHFENKDGGFFLKQSPRQHFPPQPELSGGLLAAPTSTTSPLSVDRFTVFQNSQPISVRATYGPFSTKQTVPARYVVPDPLPLNTTGPSIDLQELATHRLDMSAHIVRAEIPRDSPLLRVLFHTGTDAGLRRQLRPHQRVCVVLAAALPGHAPLRAACSPDGEDGVCLAQVTLPAAWWPPLPAAGARAPKTPPRLVQLSYAVLEARPADPEGCRARAQPQAGTPLGAVPLVAARGTYKEVRVGEAVAMMVPHPPIYPKSRVHVPVFIERAKAKLLTAVVVRGRVKSGVRILEATSSNPPAWNISVEINPRHTGASVTLVRREPPDSEPIAPNDMLELFTWLIEFGEDDAEPYEGARIVWTARFEPHQDETDNGGEIHRTEGRKSTTRFEVQKDDIQAVVPISKNWEVLNTAVLTGRQVSQAMKVFIVSQAGKAADVTFQASCHSEDDNVLKVSSSCSSVYVDGSEARGSVNGSVSVKYGTYIGLARFTVWMPEFPLDLQVPDTRLSQLKSWRVPDYHPSSSKTRRKRRSYASTWPLPTASPLDNHLDKPACRLRYQQSPVDVFAHFLATDHSSGRTTYLINRRTSLRVTDLVLPLLRVSDPRVAALRGRLLQGRSAGRTEVQVLSPITGRVIGAREVRVGTDKVALARLAVRVVSGLQLNIAPDAGVENGYVAETSVTRKLTAQYQEGLLDIELEFSDGSRTPLREVDDADYHLRVESLDPEVVAFAPMVASHHPRVIAVGEGHGELLQVTLLLPDDCRGVPRANKLKNGPLAVASATVTVDFTPSDFQHRPDILQNDGGSYTGSKRDFHDLQDILGTILKDDKVVEPNVQARQFQGGKTLFKTYSNQMTPLEISMYVLLAAFCCAIVVFVVSCVVYASKFKLDEAGLVQGVTASPIVAPSGKSGRQTVTNAHDWVWLGRATLDTSNRNSTTAGSEIRITSNPLNLNYCEPDDSLATSFSNPGHIELPSRAAAIDSSTYCRRREAEAPPPLPPHGEVEDYRPPVPPHRNVGAGEAAAKKHHHHHRHSKSAGRRERVGDELVVDGGFEFDDEPAAGERKEEGGFVECPKAPILNGRNSGEVKRATIVGNPMFSAVETKDLAGLDDLQLDMNYDQIMHYFDNLKESNA